MKKILFTLLTLIVLFSCGENKELEQDYTSFSIMQNEIEEQPNTVVGYYNNGLCLKIAELGDLKKGVYSDEVIVNNDTLTHIYVFSDYIYPSFKMDTVLILKKNRKSTFQLQRHTKGIEVDQNDPCQYPH